MQTSEQLKLLAQEITEKAVNLKNKYTDEKGARVNYVCIFSQSEEEYENLLRLAGEMGKIVRETSTGPLYQIDPLDTVAGKLQILKIRAKDNARKELGNADFTILDFEKFKKTYLSKPKFKLIKRPEMEMVELLEPGLDVIAYFSNPPMDQQLGIK